jgi:hypothetical protein
MIGFAHDASGNPNEIHAALITHRDFYLDAFERRKTRLRFEQGAACAYIPKASASRRTPACCMEADLNIKL